MNSNFRLIIWYFWILRPSLGPMLSEKYRTWDISTNNTCDLFHNVSINILKYGRSLVRNHKVFFNSFLLGGGGPTSNLCMVLVFLVTIQGTEIDVTLDDEDTIAISRPRRNAPCTFYYVPAIIIQWQSPSQVIKDDRTLWPKVITNFPAPITIVYAARRRVSYLSWQHWKVHRAQTSPGWAVILNFHLAPARMTHSAYCSKYTFSFILLVTTRRSPSRLLRSRYRVANVAFRQSINVVGRSTLKVLRVVFSFCFFTAYTIQFSPNLLRLYS